MNLLFDYPSECMICGFDGYGSVVAKHIKKEHKAILPELKRLTKLHEKGGIGLTEMREQLIALAREKQP